MKPVYIAFATVAVLAAATLCLTSCRKRTNTKTHTDDVDGGVRHYEDTDAPKVIQSTEIANFYCKFSTLDMMAEDCTVAGQMITLQATEDEGFYQLRWESEIFSEGRFIPDKDFLENLQQLVSRYDLAGYNGKYNTVSGLPPDYGIKLEIGYASGESIRAYDNQDCFLPISAMEELVALFEQNERTGV